MVTVLNPAGAWVQAANLCFLLSGFFADLLLVRIFLSFAYLWMLTGACVGYGSWPDYQATGAISVDGIVWAVMNLIVHGSAVFQMVWDERPIKFQGDDDELFRFFYRRSGMKRLEVQEVLKFGRWRSCKAGETILDELGTTQSLVLMVEGRSRIVRLQDGAVASDADLLLSGMTFDTKLFNVFGVYIGFETDPASGVQLRLHADTDCLVYEWSIQDLNTIACGLAPAVSSYFRNFILCQVALEWEFRTIGEPGGRRIKCCRGYEEPAAHAGGARSVDFSDTLAPGEEPALCVRDFFRWLWRVFGPFMPPGMRHNSLPIHGADARQRLMAMEKAASWRRAASTKGVARDSADGKTKTVEVLTAAA